MSFTQITFTFAFLPISILIYLAVYEIGGRNLRDCNAVLICAGLIFYWWAEPRLLFLFVSLIIAMYALGQAIYAGEDPARRKEITTFAIIFLAFIPVIYRYLPTMKLTDSLGEPVSMPLFAGILTPIGISFFILGAISYIVDIYKEKADPGNMADVFLYMMLFPKALCGPVVLWRDFRPQITARSLSMGKLTDGAGRIIIGYAKKVIIADTFATQIALINSKAVSATTDVGSAWLLAVLYFFRIYYDFSGYSDIAVGLSRMFGFEIGENFDYPYLSRSLTEFWRRWHISLGRWFREYIYIPLGGSRSGHIYFNILATFCIAGLWHGWKWNLLIWGLLNGAIVIIEKQIQRKSKNTGEKSSVVPRQVTLISHIALTLLLVFSGWILFKSDDLTSAGEAFKALVVPSGSELPNFTWKFFMTRRIAVFLIIAAGGAFGGLHRLGAVIKEKAGETKYDIISKAVLIVLFAIDIMFIVSTPSTPFMYTLIP